MSQGIYWKRCSSKVDLIHSKSCPTAASPFFKCIEYVEKNEYLNANSSIIPCKGFEFIRAAFRVTSISRREEKLTPHSITIQQVSENIIFKLLSLKKQY